jgi:23S rRNA-/tRNA-specific pseudouridylate synthase
VFKPGRLFAFRRSASMRKPPGRLRREQSAASRTVMCFRKMLLYEDPKVYVFNKPAGLAVQGGSGVTRHIDGMLEAWRNKKGEKPRLVHRIDRDTSGVLVVARTRGAAQALTAAFRERDTKKTYWALVKGVPRKRRGQDFHVAGQGTDA